MDSLLGPYFEDALGIYRSWESEAARQDDGGECLFGAAEAGVAQADLQVALGFGFGGCQGVGRFVVGDDHRVAVLDADDGAGRGKKAIRGRDHLITRANP